MIRRAPTKYVMSRSTAVVVLTTVLRSSSGNGSVARSRRPNHARSPGRADCLAHQRRRRLWFTDVPPSQFAITLR